MKTSSYKDFWEWTEASADGQKHGINMQTKRLRRGVFTSFNNTSNTKRTIEIEFEPISLAYTSQTCSTCGKPDDRKGSVFAQPMAREITNLKLGIKREQDCRLDIKF